MNGDNKMSNPDDIMSFVETAGEVFGESPTPSMPPVLRRLADKGAEFRNNEAEWLTRRSQNLTQGG